MWGGRSGHVEFRFMEVYQGEGILFGTFFDGKENQVTYV